MYLFNIITQITIDIIKIITTRSILSLFFPSTVVKLLEQNNHETKFISSDKHL